MIQEAFCKILDKISNLSGDKMAKIDTFISNNSVRWIILFVSVSLTYFYMLYISFTYNKDSASEEETEHAMLFNPSAGGYNKIRGDINSPSLFEWNPAEYCILILVILSTIFLYWYIVIQEKTEKLYIKLFQFILAWTHTVIIILFIPVNDFHRRMLYNLRAVAASVCNQPLQEVWIAFLLIVILPLPGSTSHKERISWLAVKLGIFYVLQNFLLGPPNYKVEPSEKNVILPDTGRDYIGYGLLVVIITILTLKENCKPV
jgi:hypothetical protein